MEWLELQQKTYSRRAGGFVGGLEVLAIQHVLNYATEPSELVWPYVWYYVILINSYLQALLFPPSRPWTQAFFFLLSLAYILWSISVLHLLFFFCCFSLCHGHSVERVASIYVWFKKRRLQREALYLGHMFIRGNGLNFWLRQSRSLLALQKKSAQVFFSSLDVAYCVYGFYILFHAKHLPMCV